MASKEEAPSVRPVKDWSAANANRRPTEVDLEIVPPFNGSVDNQLDASPTDPAEAGSAKGIPGEFFDQIRDRTDWK